MKLRATYANVAATAALVLSLGGTAYAATVITSANIKDGTIQSVDVADGALLSRDVHDGTLGGVDVLNGSLTGADVKDGSLGLADLSDTAEAALKGQKGDPGQDGAPGAPGQDGAPGADGVPGISGYVDVAGDWVNGTVSDTLTARAKCPTGKKPISGGFESATGSMAFSPAYSHHVTYPGGGIFPEVPDGGEFWEVQGHAVYNGVAGAPWSLRAWVTCGYVQ